MRHSARCLVFCAALGFAACQLGAQSQPPQPAPSSQPAPSDPLQFLGTYSAPSAVMATETSHTTSHPPSPSTRQRLAEIEGGFAVFPPWPADYTWPAGAIVRMCAETGEGNPQQADRARESAAQNLKSLSSLAEAGLKQGKVSQALAANQSLVRLHPRCGAVLWNLAVTEVYAHSAQAASSLQNPAVISPSPSAAEGMKGLLAMAQGNRAAAVDHLTKALGARSGGKEAALPQRERVWLAATQSRALGRAAKARAALEDLLGSPNASPGVWYALGVWALDEARAASRRLAETAPNSEWNQQLKAEAVRGKYPELAERLWPQSSAPSPGGPKQAGESGRNASAQLLSNERQLQAAEKSGESPAALYQQSLQARRLSELALIQAAQSREFRARLAALEALADEQENDEEGAIKAYQQGLQRDPESAILHAGLGQLYRHWLDLAGAEKELTLAWQLDPHDALVAYELGDVEQRLQHPRQAIQLLNAALQMEPGLLMARWSRARAYLQLKDPQKALADFAAAEPIDPSGGIDLQMARLYRTMGLAQKAAQAEHRAALKQRAAVH
jgi:tetratricopeptide (TPR) repeat protein